ncbi:hypothetical protein SDC9_101955 [bioreactor metagenome]|uniref:Uncharacterized protein n=1 Tax=bioreactor metagenome TaxID=1076179 RepID=A0A645APH7_9ZZZZ
MKSDQHDHGGRTGQIQLAGFAAHELDQPVVHDLDHLLPRGHALEDGFAEAVGPDLFHKFARHVDIDVGVEQGEADVAHRVGDIALAEAGLAAQPLEEIAQFVAQIIKHAMILRKFGTQS